MDRQTVAEIMLVASAVLIVAWIARHVWTEDVRKEETATDDAWHAGAELLRRARQRLQDRSS